MSNENNHFEFSSKAKKMSKKENLETAKKLISYIFIRHKIKLILVAIFVLLSTAANVGMSFFIKILIDDYIIPITKMANPDFKPLLMTIIRMSVILGLGVISTLLYSRIMVYVSEGTMKDLRNDLFTHLESLPVEYFDQNSHGYIMSYFTNDVRSLDMMLANAFPTAVSSITTIIMVLAAMLIESIPLTIIVLSTIIIMMLLIKSIGGKSSKYFLNQQASLAEETGFIEEAFDGLKVIKVFNKEEDIISKFDNINEELAKNTTMANRLSLSLFPIIFGLGNFQYIFVAFFGGLLALSGNYGITVGVVASFLQLTRSLSGPMSQISQQINQVILALAGSYRIFSFLQEEKEEDNGVVNVVRVKKNKDGSFSESKERTGLWAWKDPENKENPYTELLGDIRFNDVSFSYDGKTPILKNISLYAKPGQKVAFVGATGAGKTTITNLINRFYEIDSGSITYDGIDIKRIKKPALRRTLGMVLQDTHLFTGSVYENLKFGRNNASDIDAIDGATRVQAHDFIINLKNGYDTIISGTESDLSQGQSQLLSIARAEIYNPPVMILDEATSSIDSRTETIVQQGMDEIMKGRTTFVIAHRLSTIMNSDVIIVLDHGEIVERGDHEDLLEQKGIYYKLYTGGFEEND